MATTDINNVIDLAHALINSKQANLDPVVIAQALTNAALLTQSLASLQAKASFDKLDQLIAA